MTTDIDRAGVFSRPRARFDEDGQLEIRASSSLAADAHCGTRRRATSPPTRRPRSR